MFQVGQGVGRFAGAQQGVAGHQRVARRRGPAHRAEVAVTAQHLNLVVRGRADGYDPQRQWLEEVKTYRGELQRLPHNQRAWHWAQAETYAAMLCRQLSLPGLNVALVYYHVERDEEATPLVQWLSAEDLQGRFEALCGHFLGWAERELAHRAQRDRGLEALAFPHAEFRRGQRALAVATYRAARDGGVLLAQAPTGIGKTIATLFALLKACPAQSVDKVLFLTAKVSGRSLAWDALARLHPAPGAAALRAIELVAQDQACEHPDKVCHGASCPLACGFYDRLPAAREAAVRQSMLDRAALRRVALAHGVCPYHLAHEVVRWCDVVVADYHHYFDSAAVLHSLALACAWRVVVVVDEAHNLVERARAMYTATLEPARWQQLRATAPAALTAPLARLHRAWTQLERAQTQPFAVHEAPPARFVRALQSVATALAEQLAEAGSAPVDATLLRCHFDALAFLRLLETFGAHSMFDLSRDVAGAGARRLVPCVRNVLPAPFLAPRWARAHAVVLCSATLAPQDFYAHTLGLPRETAWLDVQAPFAPRQLQVRVVRDVSTRWRDRSASLAPIAALIGAQFRARPGNYLAFFSSFEYLERAAAEFAARHPEIAHWAQVPRMDAAGRAAFLARFEPTCRAPD